MTTEEVKWNVGDPCRAVFTDDGQEYEATIESLGDTDGVAFANVVFLYYGNQQTVWLTELLASHGPEVRAPLETAVANPEPVVEDVVEVVATPVSTKWNVGDLCRAIYAADGLVYDCTIDSLTTDEAGNQVAEVVYVGYGNKESVWSKDLLPPLDPVTDEVVAELPVDAEVAVADPTPEAKFEDAVQALNTPQLASVENAAREQEVTEQKIDETAVSEDKSAVPFITSTPIDQPSSPKWRKGDKCLAVNPEDDLEYEGIIEHIINSGEGMIATIKAVGSEKAFTAWVDSLIPSREASPASFSQATISQETSPIEMTWAVGGPCRAVKVEDGLEYEATIEDISLSDNGDRYATVELLGNGDRLTVWLVDLVESHGQAARDQQEAAIRVAKKAALEKEDDITDANEANRIRELEEANPKALNSKKEVQAEAEEAKVLLEKKEAEARAAEAIALQKKKEGEVKALEEATLKSNDLTHSTFQNPALAPSISQASEFQSSQACTVSDMPEAEGRPQVVPATFSSNVDSELRRRIKYMDSIDAAGDGSHIELMKNYYVDRFAAGDFCSFPTKPGSNTLIECLIVETWFKEGGKTLCQVKILGSDEEKFIRITELRLSRGSKARAEQLARIGAGTGAPALSGNEVLLKSKFAECEAMLKECRVEFAKSVSQNSSLEKKIEENLIQIDCLRNGNLELKAQILRDEDKIRALQENFNVARENLLLYKSKEPAVDQLTKDIRDLIGKNEDLKRVNDGLKKELSRKTFALESLENELKALKIQNSSLSGQNNINNSRFF